MYRFSLGGLQCECDHFGELLAAIYVGVRQNGRNGQVNQETVAWLSELKAGDADDLTNDNRDNLSRRSQSQANKSVAIRDYRAANPEAPPKAIAEALAKMGISVSAQFVSTVLSNAKRKGGIVGKPGPKAKRREVAAA